ncbi:unspecified product [Leishmania tarentolae]|uniref:Unspecified product n=1 Tax=Leishmania tarentolae TaxID=5689 RepID=A0A640KGZ2_LEITA|nr:unspecified product [Leishmania tarentolae]
MQYLADLLSIRVYYRRYEYDVPVEFITRMYPGSGSFLMRYKDSEVAKDLER